jgi:DNA-binding NtrC family response regulator
MNGTLLIVDDEEPFITTLEKRLVKRSLRVISASGGSEALEALERENDIDVVLLDVKMPEIDGMATLRLIKTQYPDIEVILLSGHATMESALEGMKLGAFDYLMKPCSIEHVVARIGEARKKKRRP